MLRAALSHRINLITNDYFIDTETLKVTNLTLFQKKFEILLVLTVDEFSAVC